MRKILLLIGGGLVVLLILIVGISTLTTQLQQRHEKQIAATFIQEALDNNSQASYGMFTSTARNAQSQESWAATTKKLSTFFKGQTPQFQKLILTSKTNVTVSYTITGSDGDYVMSTILVKTKVGWQVLTFTSRLQTS